MYGEEWDCDEDMESYYEGRAEGNEMLTEEQHKALDDILKGAKDSIIEDLKRRSLIDFMNEGKELARYKIHKDKVEKELHEKEGKARELDWKIKNREYEISQKEKGLEKKEKELQANYEEAIEKYAYDSESVLKELLKGKLGKALKNFTFPKFYEVTYDYVPQEKCSLCDENRKRHFKDDQGKIYKVSCPCNNKHYVYKVIDARIKFYLGFIPSIIEDTDSVEKILTKSISINFHSTNRSYSQLLEKCFNSKLETVKEYKTRIGYSDECFTSIVNAQLYADYMQKLDDEKTKNNYMDLRLNEFLTYQED